MADERDGFGRPEGHESIPPELKPLDTWLQTDSAAWQAEVPSDARMNEQARILVGNQQLLPKDDPAAAMPTWPPANGGSTPQDHNKHSGPHSRWQIWMAAVAAVLVVALMSVVLLNLTQHRGTSSVANEPTATGQATASGTATPARTATASPTTMGSPTASATNAPVPTPTPLPIPSAATPVGAPQQAAQSVWSDPSSTQAFMQPVVANGVVYTADTGTGNGLYAFDEQTGAQHWVSHLVRTATPPLAVAGGLLYVRPQMDTLTSYHVSDGSWAWTLQPANGDWVGPATVDSGVLYALGVPPRAPFIGTLYACDPTTGAVLWTSTLSGPNFDSLGTDAPVVSNGFIYVTANNAGSGPTTVLAINVADHSVHWTASLPYRQIAISAANGMVFVSGSTQNVDTNVSLTALDGNNGVVQWRLPLPNTGDEISPAVVGGDTLYVSTLTGAVYAINSATGAERWGAQLSGSRCSNPAVGTGVVYVGTTAGMNALDAATGQLRWDAANSSDTAGVPTIADGLVFFGANGLYAFKA